LRKNRDEELLTVREAMEKLGLHNRLHFNKLIETKKLPYSMKGTHIRLAQGDVERYLAAVKAAAPVCPPAMGAWVFRSGPVPPPSLDSWSVPAPPVDISKAGILCGHDSCVGLLTERLAEEGIPILQSSVGCYDGLYDLYHRRIVMTVVNLWDSKSDEYNYPFIKALLPGTPVGILRLAGRMQGLYAAAGNPLRIRGWTEFARPGMRMINRTRGSGERILLDQKLSWLGIDTGKIQGYGIEAGSNAAAACAVARGRADLGYGTDTGAEGMAGLEFIPLQQEWYDIVFRLEDRETPAVRTVLRYVASGEFKQDMEVRERCDVSQTGRYEEFAAQGLGQMA
jgi:putative molybdopterin biosynthesis protein